MLLSDVDLAVPSKLRDAKKFMDESAIGFHEAQAELERVVNRVNNYRLSVIRENLSSRGLGVCANCGRIRKRVNLQIYWWHLDGGEIHGPYCGACISKSYGGIRTTSDLHLIRKGEDGCLEWLARNLLGFTTSDIPTEPDFWNQTDILFTETEKAWSNAVVRVTMGEVVKRLKVRPLLSLSHTYDLENLPQIKARVTYAE